jgi:hypothetical protein
MPDERRNYKMFRLRQSIAASFVTAALAFIPAVSAAANLVQETSSRVVELTPFTHVAYIPADADLSSIRLRGIKAAMVATRRRSITELHYCDEQRLLTEPGGSIYCPLTRDESAVPAYQVTYTLTAPPKASDEYGNTSFTFNVYFQADELGSSLRKGLMSKKVSRMDLSEYFQITASRQSVDQLVVDQANSTFCDGNYLDGNWTRSNSNCQDNIRYKKAAIASPYITVRVDEVSHLQASAATGASQ